MSKMVYVLGVLIGYSRRQTIICTTISSKTFWRWTQCWWQADGMKWRTLSVKLRRISVKSFHVNLPLMDETVFLAKKVETLNTFRLGKWHKIIHKIVEGLWLNTTIALALLWERSFIPVLPATPLPCLILHRGDHSSIHQTDIYLNIYYIASTVPGLHWWTKQSSCFRET